MLDRYVAREVAIVLAITAPALCLLIVILQAMRLLPLVVAAELGVSDASQVIGLMFVPLSAVTVPAALVLSIMVVFSRLEGDGELLALRTCGISSTRLARAPGVVCLLVALGAGALTLFAEPEAYRSLDDRLGDVLVRASLGRIRPGVIAEPFPNLTVLADRRRGRHLERVFIEDRRRDPATVLTAREANLAPVRGQPAARLVLEEGSVQSRAGDGLLTRASFGRLETTVEIDSASAGAAVIPPRFGLDLVALWREASAEGRPGREAALLLHRRLAVAPGALGLCLLALFLMLSRPIATKTWSIVAGAGLVLAFHLFSRIGEALVESSVLSPESGGWLPVALCWSALIVAVAVRRQRREGRTEGSGKA
jgi:lipopolysaccharide export LptBFGC system permease protein LptF